MDKQTQLLWNCMSPQNKDVFGTFQSEESLKAEISKIIGERISDLDAEFKKTEDAFMEQQRQYQILRHTLEEYAKDLPQLQGSFELFSKDEIAEIEKTITIGGKE